MSNARKLADNLPIDGQIGIGRNMLINGSMQVTQRNSSVTGIGASGSAYITHDRWKIKANNTAGRFTMEQSTDAPSGFTNSLKFSCTTADSSIAADEELRLSQHIEAGSCARTMTGTSDAKQITLSFYAKADSTKTYVAQILNNKHSGYIHNNRTFTVTSSWQRFEMTFQADTTADSKMDGTLTDAGFSLSFWLHAGSNYTSATLASDWATGTTNRAAGTQSFFSSTNNRFYLTGCQLEVGSQSTPFEHEPYGETLRKCQRYFYLETPTSTDSSGRLGVCSHSTTVVFDHTLPVQMRTKPSLSLTSASLRIGDTVSQGFTTSSGTVAQNTYSGTQSITYILGGFSGLTTYRTYLHEPDAASPGMVKFDAEL